MNMNCNRFETLLESLERNAPMAAELRSAALQHAESCGQCRARLAAARLLHMELQTLAKEDENLQAPARLEANLLSAFRERSLRPSRVWRSVSWASLAAAVAVGIWLLAEQPWRQAGPSPLVKIQAAQPASLPQIATTVKTRIAGKNSIHRRSRPTGSRTAASIADEFIALSSGGSWYPVGDGMVVRVQVPRSAPALVGLPISGGDVSGTVTADVVLGEDGVARAIRFVTPSEGKGRNQNSDFAQN
jgi:hypothetical protein